MHLSITVINVLLQQYVQAALPTTILMDLEFVPFVIVTVQPVMDLHHVHCATQSLTFLEECVPCVLLLCQGVPIVPQVLCVISVTVISTST